MICYRRQRKKLENEMNDRRIADERKNVQCAIVSGTRATDRAESLGARALDALSLFTMTLNVDDIWHPNM
jgi:hypothetical protein